MKYPLVARIQRLSTHDGPGLRDVIFFKGCPLHCLWCHNPENVNAAATMLWFEERCISCGKCQDACPNPGHSKGAQPPVHSNQCTCCGVCADACPALAIERVGRKIEPKDLVSTLLKDKSYFDNSNGGITFSGGEPALWPKYVGNVAQSLKQHGVTVGIETAGYFDLGPFQQLLQPWLDFIFFDLKLYDAKAHQKYTGIDNAQILSNFSILARQMGQRLIPRTPLVPGITDTEENLRHIGALVSKSGAGQWQHLTFNSSYELKWKCMGQAPATFHSGKNDSVNAPQ
ncbi:MAG: glycyl-radical enzyme activating protein [Deltaproteobacteria bacterium]|nr:glycyl-radical enzyme activating protein [Deltaproteobacteria bacterium]